MQHLLRLSFVKNRRFARAVEQFVDEQEARGIILRNQDVPERLCAVKTLLVDDTMIMQGRNAVRRVSAPLEACEVDKLKRQRAWMVLAAGVALGCENNAPLEQFAQNINFSREKMMRQYPQLHRLPSGPRHRVDTTIHRDAGGLRAYTKGDIGEVLARCNRVLDGKERELADIDRAKAQSIALRMEAEGLSTLAFATNLRQEGEDEFERGMVFLGIVGMGDLPDEDSPWAMDALRLEGLRPVVVAGQPMTAGAAQATGALREEGGIMDAEEFDALADEQLREAVVHVDVFTGMDWRRRRRLAKAMRNDGTVATLTRDVEGTAVVAMGDGSTPDVVLERGTMRAMVRMIRDCHGLMDEYTV